jgi:hypothetical protein
LEFLLGLLGEEVIGDPDGELPVAVQIFHDAIIVRVVLEATTGVNHARDTKPVELAHEVARRVLLVLGRELGTFGQGCIKDGGVRLRDQEPSWVAASVANDLAASKVRRVPGVADGAQGGTVQQRPVVEMEDEDRVSGAAALISSSVGRRFSANWCSENPPTTRTHCGAGVRSTWSLSIRMASASERTPSQRSSML